MLGFLFIWAPLIFFALIIWTYFFNDYVLIGNIPAPIKFHAKEWLVGAGIVSAICSSAGTGYITVRNGIKQHTINTMLQSRMSAQYSEHAATINRTYFAPGMPKYEPVPLSEFLDPANASHLQSVNYVLNYFEFLAVAIRHGDLDELMMRQMMKGIIVRLCMRASEYIAYTREEVNGVLTVPTTQFEHITWLLGWWKLDHRSPWKRFTDWFEALFVVLEAKS